LLPTQETTSSEKSLLIAPLQLWLTTVIPDQTTEMALLQRSTLLAGFLSMAIAMFTWLIRSIIVYVGSLPQVLQFNTQASGLLAQLIELDGMQDSIAQQELPSTNTKAVLLRMLCQNVKIYPVCDRLCHAAHTPKSTEYFRFNHLCFCFHITYVVKQGH
jgi:hypothetical protein